LLVRLIRVYDQAVRGFGDKEKALHWLSEAKGRFDGRTPIQMLRTDLDGRVVEEMLGQIYYGMFD
jgi:putative toxin-antitoxin system antitoxin component (TIGR02293 family)